MNETTFQPPSRKDYIGNIFMSNRWLLTYFYVGLQIGMYLYAYKYTLKVIEAVMSVHGSEEDDFMLIILGLVDMTMIANLVDMIKSGSYSIFVRRFSLIDKEDRPQWLDHMSTGLQKVKMASSILGISSVGLLRAFVDSKHVDWTATQHQIILHLVFCVSGLTLVGMDYLSAQTKTQHKHEESHS